MSKSFSMYQFTQRTLPIKTVDLRLAALLVLAASLACAGAPAPGTAPAAAKARTAVNPPAAVTFTVSARILAAGRPARDKGASGASELRSSEKSLASFIGYRDYKVIAAAEKTIGLSEAFRIPINDRYAVTITPLGDLGARLKLKVAWETPDRQTWEKVLYFVRDVRSLVGGPELPGGGLYLLSVNVR